MSRFLQLIATLILTYTFSSCTIYEDIYFSDNGNIKYDLTIDMTEATQSMGDLNFSDDKFPTERISIAQSFRDSIGDISQLPEKYSNMINDLEPFYLKMTMKDDSQETKINISGDFKNQEKLNKGLVALAKSQELKQYIQSLNINEKLSSDSEIPNMPINNTSTFSWDGKTMRRHYEIVPEEIVEEVEEKEASIEEEGLIGQMANQMMEQMKQMLSFGKYLYAIPLSKAY